MSDVANRGVTSNNLPQNFRDLDPWVSEWALGSERQRFAKRTGSTIEEIRPFYDAVSPRMPAVMAYLEKLPIEGLTPEDDALLQIAMSYVEISRCFEAWNQVDVRADFFKPADLQTDR
ncbi:MULTISPECIES: hypothetical protein [unclassified Sphingomonas]|uniref:hypothetical protein n=1 Tax=unclassified Sphingomonas TaxID=196159 RepID=UPI00027CBBB5|nr:MULTISPECIES: hypothetical protein [unclassified Sphingomonas]EJU15014.1 hypothetical protein LH128_00797 [Sphingomonas sp. LH128]QDK35588.1 hypothetical protein DM450_22920 [Sphingomonas sp. IC081]